MLSLPVVGGPLKVANSIRNGHPNTWGEIGWAAWDVADCALLAASFGGSGAVTAAKQALKEGGKVAFTRVEKAAVKQAARRAAGEVLFDPFPSLVAQFGRRHVRHRSTTAAVAQAYGRSFMESLLG